jgi:hypothetical protein
VRKGITLIVCAVALAGAGCARQDPSSTPEGCRAGPGEVRRALASAPGEVRVAGTPISKCLGDTSDGGDLTAVGSSYVYVAAHLADRAAARPEGPEALQLGYLLGAIKRSEHGAQGVGYELGRRLEAEAQRVPARSRALRRGRRAGRARG